MEYSGALVLDLVLKNTGGLADADRLRKSLDDLSDADKGSTVRYLTSDKNELDALFFCTSSMTDTYQRYPEVLFFDGTYK